MDGKNLNQLRQQIDEINDQILTLLNQRTEIVKLIGIEKQKHELKVHDPVREQKIMTELLEKNEGPLSNKLVSHIFTEIFKLSVQVQETQLHKNDK